MIKLGLGMIKKISLGVIFLLAQMFMFVNAPLFFGSQADFYQKVITIYMIMLVTIFALPDTRLKLFSQKISTLWTFVIWFVGSVFFLSIAGALFGGDIYKSFTIGAGSLSMVIFHFIIVAFVEEFFFREFLMKRIGIIWSSLAFGLFHFVAYGFVWGNIIYASFMGVVLAFIKIKFSPKSNMANIGFHAGYNVKALGFLKILGG